MHVTQVDPLHHHRTLLVLVAVAIALVLAIATFVVVDDLTSSGTGLPGARSSTGASSGQDGTFLDPAVFDPALGEATIARAPGAPSAPAATGTSAGTTPSIIEHPGAFDAALAEALGEVAVSKR